MMDQIGHFGVATGAITVFGTLLFRMIVFDRAMHRLLAATASVTIVGGVAWRVAQSALSGGSVPTVLAGTRFGHVAPMQTLLTETPETCAVACARTLEARIAELGPETVLAFIVEPVGGLSTGAVLPPPTFFRGMRDIWTRHCVLLIFDEVLCGAGCTGRFFAAHHWPDALPDIVVQAKGLGPGHAPPGAMLV